MDNMLINLPDKDGKHILIRSSKDGDTKYSWETVNLIVNVNDIVVGLIVEKIAEVVEIKEEDNKKYALDYDNFYAFHKENEGQGVARNFGLKKAKGEYVPAYRCSSL